MTNAPARRCLPVLLLLAFVACFPAAAESLKVHSVFSSNMVIQRDKPIKVWGWAAKGTPVTVTATFASEAATAEAAGEDGLWEVTFEAQEANATPQTITVATGDEKVVLENILIGDIWVMYGQSNMAWGLSKTRHTDMQRAKANLPLLRELRINPNEQSELQKDINASALPNGGWITCSPETAGGISAIGYAFGADLQRVLNVPIGLIDNGRGGAAIESLVPERKLDEDPLTKRYYEHVKQREAEFDIEEFVAGQVERWEKKVVQLREKGTPENKLPKKPTVEGVRSWSIPGMSPSDAGACYNGMFGSFIGLNIKGVLFHQGYNNTGANARPKRYRTIMRLMIEGLREDFDAPELPVGVIGFCAGAPAQTDENFEAWTMSSAPYIREAQRLGLQDVGDPANTAFLPAFDVQIPGLHPSKKKDHGERAARWALKNVYRKRVDWDAASLVSAEPVGDEMLLTFDQKVMPHDFSPIPRGFAIAGEDGKFYKAYARYRFTKEFGIWGNANKGNDPTIIHVWSPLVDKPVAVRYGWAPSGLSNLYANGKPWAPLASFRTDDWDWPESEDPAEALIGRRAHRAMGKEALGRNAERLKREAEMAVVIYERLKTLGRDTPAE